MSNSGQYKQPNIPLLIFDIILIPVHLLRIILIYFWGSKYNLRGFSFLDVIMHADKPYFNQEDCSVIDTIGKDYRIVVRDDSRLFPVDIAKYLKIEHSVKQPDVIIGSTCTKTESKWNVTTEEPEDSDASESDEDDSVKSFDVEKQNKKRSANQPNILDSIKDELNSALE